MAGDAGDHCRGALAHLDVRSQPVAESGFRFAAERLVRQQLGVHLPQGAVFRGGRIAFSSDPSVVLGRDDAVLSGLAVADGGARQNHQVQMGALHGDSCHHAASTADMVLLFDPANTSRVYYGTDTRLAELAAGALLAIWIAPSSRGTEAAEAGAASQTVQIERQAGDKTAPLSLSSAMFLAPRLWRHC